MIDLKLKETIPMMESKDYKERFKAEYYQLVIRYKKLSEMLKKWDSKNLSFRPTCDRGIYDSQLRAMLDYMAVLEERAVIENIKLEEITA